MGLEVLHINSWTDIPSSELQQQAISALENGKVVLLPDLEFKLQTQEFEFLAPEMCGNRKNICYDQRFDKLSGFNPQITNQAGLHNLMRRYAQVSRNLLNNLFPSYIPTAVQGRTSFRPVEIAGRLPKSYRKDDTRLHVDAFPATPMQGRRILRVFTNVNPHGVARIWRIGDAFNNVVEQFAPTVRAPIPGLSKFLKATNITRGYRTLYDHYMLQIHNNMKANLQYQQDVSQQEVHFPPGSTWFVYTDQVSHAAMSGQHVFEQTFNLPVDGLQDPTTAPLRVLEEHLQKVLVK